MEAKNRHAVLQPLLQIVKDVKLRRQGCTDGCFIKIDLWLQKLSNLVITRGYKYLLVDLPDIGKAYDAGLSTGIFNANSIPKDLGGAKGFNSWFFQYLLRETFDETGRCLNPDPEVVFLTRQVLYMYKKVKIDCPSSALRKAIDDFISIEEDLPEPSGSWHEDNWIDRRYFFSDDDELKACHPRGEKLWSIVDRVFGSIIPMHSLDPYSIRPSHGPGSVADLKTGLDKFQFPTWPNKLANVFPFEDFSSPNWMTFMSVDNGLSTSDEEPPARLIAVPKSFKGPRLIASEPVSHQFLQQGLMKWIRQNMTEPLRRSIEFRSQVPSQEAALAASKNGLYATVDLSSASDRLTCYTVERAFGANQTLLRALHAVRTRSIVDATGTYPDLNLRLKKFAAQGSAVTFPIQTIVYAGLCISAVLFANNSSPNRKNILRVSREVRVFGDDICLPRDAVPYLSLLLQTLKLKVNGSKTHYSGAFRESCGVDAYRGYDVSPCYLSAWTLGPSPENLVSWVDISNNAHQAGLWNLADWMTRNLPNKVRRLMATTQETGDGFRLFTFNHGFMTEGRERWNENYHRYEHRLLTSRSRVRKKGRRSWQDLYQYLIESPTPDCHWSSGYLTKKSTVLKVDWVPAP